MFIEKEISVANGTFPDLMEELAKEFANIGIHKIEEECSVGFYTFKKGQLFIKISLNDRAMQIQPYYLNSGSRLSVCSITSDYFGTGPITKTYRSIKVRIVQNNNTWGVFFSAPDSDDYRACLLVSDCLSVDNKEDINIVCWNANWNTSSSTLVYYDLGNNKNCEITTFYDEAGNGDIIHIDQNLTFIHAGSFYAVAKDLELFLGTLKGNIYIINNKKYFSFEHYCIKISD